MDGLDDVLVHDYMRTEYFYLYTSEVWNAQNNQTMK